MRVEYPQPESHVSSAGKEGTNPNAISLRLATPKHQSPTFPLCIEAARYICKLLRVIRYGKEKRG